MKLCENLSGGSQVVPFRQVGMIRLVVTVLQTCLQVAGSGYLNSMGRDHWIKFIVLQ